ncbi:heavy metal translocating P-type ATPase [Paracnuella aquatica]|uniref:heavy metal translocating P-type ATPase n=1 Tax=Paracnuella aquatica TaxID=2268757 RepID=UPI000DEF0B27|nr:cation-translocating P-type ATPase [Paracnuella aquatica]RPD43691.1 cadmium-translocating P-type ATPase [Paracnuella aquatica]
MEKIQWKVDGIHCANCALTINKYLQQSGAQNVSVNPIDGDVSFDINGAATKQQLAKGMEGLGYKVASEGGVATEGKKPFLHNNIQRFWFCLPFTLVLMLHMIPGLHIHWLMNPWVQLALTLPVYFVGMRHFGRSAIKSLRDGIPNMNVLISIGATAAFVYSLIGALMGLGDDYLFFETAATIITLVFFGEFLEESTMKSTQRSLKALVKSQKVMANMIAYDDQHQEHVFPVESTALKNGDLLLIRTGEQVPADCKILWGEAEVSEALLTGESLPVAKGKKDMLIGGSVLESGSVKAIVTAAGNDTVLSGILNMVKKAQGEKPPVQQLADRISAIFVPVVLGIAAVTLIANWIILGAFTPAMMRSIAVLVIACPCAMGLATPAAIAVGLGRGARNGILFRQAKSLELFRNIKQVVFDKTGTLTTGKFVIANYSFTNIAETDFKNIVWSLEKFSNHPLAKSIVEAWKGAAPIRWKKVEEVKGLGMVATDFDGNEYKAGSYQVAAHLTNDQSHNIYVLRNGELLGWIDLQDEIRAEAADVVNYLRVRGIKTILLSGDRYEKCKQLADTLGIDEVIAEQTPEQKLTKIALLSEQQPTIMVGDGINDAPALTKATIGISMSDASQLAMQSAHVVLMNSGLKKLPEALGLGRNTYLTIKQNLFWAFSYNIVAIPIAALGFLSPAFAALVMGLSDVVLAINSGRLFVKKVV